MSGNKFDDCRQTSERSFQLQVCVGIDVEKVLEPILFFVFLILQHNPNARCAAFRLFSWGDQILARMFGWYLGYDFVLTLSSIKAQRDCKATTLVNETADHLGTRSKSTHQRDTLKNS